MYNKIAKHLFVSLNLMYIEFVFNEYTPFQGNTFTFRITKNMLTFLKILFAWKTYTCVEIFSGNVHTSLLKTLSLSGIAATIGVVFIHLDKIRNVFDSSF